MSNDLIFVKKTKKKNPWKRIYSLANCSGYAAAMSSTILFLPLQYEVCCLLFYRPASTLPPLLIVLPPLFDTHSFRSTCLPLPERGNISTKPAVQEGRERPDIGMVTLEWFSTLKTSIIHAIQGKDRTILSCFMYMDEGSRILGEFSKLRAKTDPTPALKVREIFLSVSLSLYTVDRG